MVAVIHRTTLRYIPSANEPDYPEPTWKWNPDMTQVAGISAIYWRWDAGTERPVPMTAGEQSAVDAALATARRDQTVAQFDSVENILRAFAGLLVDELNAHSAKVNAILTAIDNGASLGAIKTAVAAIADLPTRQLSDLRTAIRNKLGN